MLEQGQIFLYPSHAMFDFVDDLLIGLAGLGHGAISAIPQGGNLSPGDFVSMSCKHLDLTLRLPLGSVFLHVMSETPPQIIGIGVRRGRGFDGSNWAVPLRRWSEASFWPTFIAFYETNRENWVRRAGQSPPTGDDAWSMGWVLRNFYSHGKKITWDKKRPPTSITWRGLTVDRSQHLKGFDQLNGIDLLILMLDMAEEMRTGRQNSIESIAC